MKKYIVFFAAMAMIMSSCYESDQGGTTQVDPKYVIEDSSDPIDHARYLIFKNTGVYVFYNYTEIDYKWNIETISPNVLLLQEDRAVLADAMTYLDRVLFDYYSDEFAGKYFPLRILLAKEINHTNSLTALTDRIAASGRSYLAIGRLSETSMPSTAAELNAAKGVIHGEMWGYTIYLNGLIEIPENFFAVSEGFYGVDYNADTANKDLPETLFKLGFWKYDELRSAQSNYFTPDRAADVSDFVEMITSHTAAEMNALMATYKPLSQKYTILINAVREATGVDLQEIGNNKPAAI